MGTSESRLKRLQTWIDDQFAGNVAGFCRYYNLPKSMASFIYQLTGGNRQFGERAARKLEQATGRPEGWLDQVMVQDNSDPIQYDRALCRKLPVQERRLIEDFIGLVLTRNDLRERPVQANGVLLPSTDAPRKGVHRAQGATVRSRGRGLDIHDPIKTRKRSNRTS